MMHFQRMTNYQRRNANDIRLFYFSGDNDPESDAFQSEISHFMYIILNHISPLKSRFFVSDNEYVEADAKTIKFSSRAIANLTSEHLEVLSAKLHNHHLQAYQRAKDCNEASSALKSTAMYADQDSIEYVAKKIGTECLVRDANDNLRQAGSIRAAACYIDKQVPVFKAKELIVMPFNMCWQMLNNCRG